MEVNNLYYITVLITTGPTKETINPDLHICRAFIRRSATLYNTNTTEKNEAWLSVWLKRNPAFGQMDKVNFHCYAVDGYNKTKLTVKQAGEMATVSITTLMLSAQQSRLQYLDLVNHTTYKEFLPLVASTRKGAVANAS